MSWITDAVGITPSVQGKLLLSAIALIAVILARWLVLRALHRRSEETEIVYRAGKVATYVGTVVILMLLAWIWLDAFSNLATYLGIASAGIAIALSDVLRNMAGWAYIVVRRPFRVGDRVEVAGTKGDVIDVRLFRFTLAEVGNWVDAEQATGRLVHVPNGLLFGTQLANYTEGFEFLWHEVPVLITFESDWRAAERAMLDVLAAVAPDVEARAGSRVRETARSYHLKLGVLKPTVYLAVKDSGVLLTARFLVDVRQRRSLDEAFWRSLLDLFARDDTIELAYPTVRSYVAGPLDLRVDRSHLGAGGSTGSGE